MTSEDDEHRQGDCPPTTLTLSNKHKMALQIDGGTMLFLLCLMGPERTLLANMVSVVLSCVRTYIFEV